MYSVLTHMTHMTHTTCGAASRFFTPNTTPDTPDTILLLNPLKKIMKIICGKENVEAFNRELKAHTPAFHGLLKELHTAGMISGLRGVTLETGDFKQPSAPAAAQQEPEATKHCEDCNQWVRNTVGFGAGVGKCLIDSMPSLLKWPKQTACNKFEVSA